MAMAIAMPRKLDDYLFFTSTFGNSLMLRLDSASPSASVAWKGNQKNSIDSVFATPFLEDGHVYGTSSNGDLCCVEAATGKRVWSTFQPNGGKLIRSADLFLVKQGDRFFIANEMGDLIIAKLSPKGYQEISRAHLREPTSNAFGRNVVWSHPAFANRCVYLRDDKQILCFSLAASGEK
jgi:outer membrane protein assembly factor BamB